MTKHNQKFSISYRSNHPTKCWVKLICQEVIKKRTEIHWSYCSEFRLCLSNSKNLSTISFVFVVVILIDDIAKLTWNMWNLNGTTFSALKIQVTNRNSNKTFFFWDIIAMFERFMGFLFSYVALVGVLFYSNK